MLYGQEDVDFETSSEEILFSVLMECKYRFCINTFILSARGAEDLFRTCILRCIFKVDLRSLQIQHRFALKLKSPTFSWTTCLKKIGIFGQTAGTWFLIKKN